MTRTKITYFEDSDTLHLAISEEPEAGSVEISPDVTAELNAQGELIGVEIINASAYLRDTILESTREVTGGAIPSVRRGGMRLASEGVAGP